MAYGVKALRRIQLGRESTPGSAVAATSIWQGPAAGIKDESALTLVDENVGYLGQTDRAFFGNAGASLEIPETELTFEQVLHVLEGGVKTVSPSSNGGTSNGYIYTYALPSTAAGFITAAGNANPIKTYTIEAGDNSGAYRMAFALCTKFSISGAPSEALKLSSTWVGAQKSSNAFTSLSPTTVEEALFNKAGLYLDDSGGTVGTTLKSGTWLGFSLDVEIWKAVYTGSGSLGYTLLKTVRPKISGSITLEYDTTGVAAETKFAANTTQLMRLNFPGSALTGAGGTYTTKLFRLDCAVKYTSVDPIGDSDGDDTVTVNFEGVWGNSGQLAPTFVVCNTLASVP